MDRASGLGDHALGRTLEDASGEFPDDLFTFNQRKNGAVILHALGILFMFIGLAIGMSTGCPFTYLYAYDR